MERNPFRRTIFISQSESASEAYARHRARLAAVDAGKELLLQEIRTLGDIKKKLLEQFIAADAEERVRIRRDLDEIGASLRQLNIGTQSLKYLRAPTDQPPPSSKLPEVSAHWMDKFNELARAHNEPWRADVLARALATESSAPNTVSPRVLWLLGTMEEDRFDSFATILDLCSSVAGELLIPAHHSFIERAIPDCPLGDGISIGNLVYGLEEIGLIADPLMTSLTLKKDAKFHAAYGPTRFLISCTDVLRVNGVIPTRLGKSVAAFYEPKVNPLGQEIFDAWIGSLDKTKFSTKSVAQLN